MDAMHIHRLDEWKSKYLLHTFLASCSDLYSIGRLLICQVNRRPEVGFLRECPGVQMLTDNMQTPPAVKWAEQHVSCSCSLYGAIIEDNTGVKSSWDCPIKLSWSVLVYRGFTGSFLSVLVSITRVHLDQADQIFMSVVFLSF